MSDPVAWMDAHDHTNLYYRKPTQVDVIALYTHPPAAQPVRDREADRQRFPDAAFNRWLDEGISDAGHTVWDLIADVCDAWHGWVNRPFYEPDRPALAAHESYWHKIADERAAEIVRLLEVIEFVLPMWEEEVRGHYSAGARTNGTKALEMMRAAIDSEREKG